MSNFKGKGIDPDHEEYKDMVVHEKKSLTQLLKLFKDVEPNNDLVVIVPELVNEYDYMTDPNGKKTKTKFYLSPALIDQEKEKAAKKGGLVIAVGKDVKAMGGTLRVGDRVVIRPDTLAAYTDIREGYYVLIVDGYNITHRTEKSKLKTKANE